MRPCSNRRIRAQGGIFAPPAHFNEPIYFMCKKRRSISVKKRRSVSTVIEALRVGAKPDSLDLKERSKA